MRTKMSCNTAEADLKATQPGYHTSNPAATYLVSQGGTYYPLVNTQGYMMESAPEKACCNGAWEPSKQTAKYDELDVYSLKPNVQVDFGETFQEPKGSESFNFVWKYNKVIYTWTMRIFFSFLVGVIGPILAIAWGLVFALMNFAVIWLVNPFLKVILQAARITEVLCRGVLRATLDPLFQSIGQVFTYMRGNFSLDLKGVQGLVGGAKPEESRA